MKEWLALIGFPAMDTNIFPDTFNRRLKTWPLDWTSCEVNECSAVKRSLTKFEPLSAVFLKMKILCNIKPCRLVNSSNVSKDRSAIYFMVNLLVSVHESKKFFEISVILFHVAYLLRKLEALRNSLLALSTKLLFPFSGQNRK